jgi:hypothetical protein
VPSACPLSVTGPRVRFTLDSVAKLSLRASGTRDSLEEA